MTIYGGLFIGDFAKNIFFKERNSGTSVSQIELLRKKSTRFCVILQTSVIPRLKLGDHILLLLIKTRRE